MTNALPIPPYPAETKAGGWPLSADFQAIKLSRGWLLARDDERPWWLMIFVMSWAAPVIGSVGSDDEITGLTGINPDFLDERRSRLLGGWSVHSDGRRYHPLMTKEVSRLIKIREMREGWDRARDFVLARDGNKCRYCGTTEGQMHVDHVFPKIRGGSNNPENLVVACAACNLSKGARTPEEWLGCINRRGGE
jgi:hypothetical protein